MWRCRGVFPVLKESHKKCKMRLSFPSLPAQTTLCLCCQAWLGLNLLRPIWPSLWELLFQPKEARNNTKTWTQNSGSFFHSSNSQKPSLASGTVPIQWGSSLVRLKHPEKFTEVQSRTPQCVWGPGIEHDLVQRNGGGRGERAQKCQSRQRRKSVASTSFAFSPKVCGACTLLSVYFWDTCTLLGKCNTATKEINRSQPLLMPLFSPCSCHWRGTGNRERGSPMARAMRRAFMRRGARQGSE